MNLFSIVNSCTVCCSLSVHDDCCGLDMLRDVVEHTIYYSVRECLLASFRLNMLQQAGQLCGRHLARWTEVVILIIGRRHTGSHGVLGFSEHVLGAGVILGSELIDV